jgi:hypothetical protein
MSSDSDRSHEGDSSDQIMDMRRLLERAEQFAVTVRDELTALESIRKETLAGLQTEADGIRAAALQDAENIRAQADEEARSMIARGRLEANGVTEAAYEELRQVKQLIGQYKQAMETSRRLFDDLPDTPSSEPGISTDAKDNGVSDGGSDRPPASNGARESIDKLDRIIDLPGSASG